MGYSQVDQYCLLFVVGGGSPQDRAGNAALTADVERCGGGGWVEIFKDVGVWGK